jgi:micrococcal nuclease
MPLVVGCYTPPDLETTPYEAPILSSGEDGPLSVCRPTQKATVACTLDGDTLDLGACGENQGGERIRLLGLDAPEIESDGVEADCYGDLAADELRRIANGRYLTFSFDSECEGVFGRTLAYAWMDLEDAEQVLDTRFLDEILDSETFDDSSDRPLVLLNQYMLVAGFARLFAEERFERLRWERQFIAAERVASVRKYGLWAACEP